MKLPPKNALLLLFLISGSTTGILALAFHLNQAQQRNRDLHRTLELLNTSFETERQQYELQRDSVQQIIIGQEKQQLALKEGISALEKRKAAINNNYHEKALSILRIRAVDSLHDEVARHYRH